MNINAELRQTKGVFLIIHETYCVDLYNNIRAMTFWFGSRL